MYMKNLIIVVVFAIVTGLIISCRSTKNFPTSFFEKLTSAPERVIDSIKKADTLISIPLNYLSKWNKSMYVTSDSVMTTQYVAVTQKGDTTFIISVTSIDGDSISLIKYRKE